MGPAELDSSHVAPGEAGWLRGSQAPRGRRPETPVCQRLGAAVSLSTSGTLGPPALGERGEASGPGHLLGPWSWEPSSVQGSS